MGIHKHYKCNTSFWNFAQWLVQGQHYVTFSSRQTKFYVHRHLWFGWSQTLARGDTIIIWVYQGIRCHQHKESVLVGGPIIGFYLQQIGNCKFPSMNGQATPNNFEV
jgi:hypothetical protein